MALAAHDLLHAIASSGRPAGSAAEQRARKLCAIRLCDAGFTVVDRPFEYSSFPGRLGTPVIGVLLAAIGCETAWLAASDKFGSVAALTVTASICAVSAAGWWLGRYGSVSLMLMRRSAVNLEASRGVAKVWLVAHLDTKSQPVSLLIRAAGVVVTLLACVALVVATGGVLTGLLPGSWAAPAGWALLVGALPLVLSWVGHSGGTGALDNATGVAAVIRAAELVDPSLGLGVLISSAEELGLAGARGWLAQCKPIGVAVNCDGVDDDGVLTCTIARGGGIFGRALAEIAAAQGHRCRVRRSIPGVLFDANAFAAAGWPAVTVSVGGLRSLARVHTRADTLDQVHGNRVQPTAEMLAGLVGSIIAGDSEATGDVTAEVLEENGSTGD